MIKNTPSNKQISLKIQLEKSATPEIKKIFRVILGTFKKSVLDTQEVPEYFQFSQIWRVWLEKHYMRVQKVFEKTVVFVPPEKQKEEEDQEDKQILILAFLAWREQNVNATADQISQTTQKNMAEAVKQARKNAESEGLILTDRELAISATVILQKKFEERVDNIAVTTTQQAAESTKSIKVNKTIEARAKKRKLIPIKIWWTRLDDRVRPWHVKAHGQKQRVEMPFIVPIKGRRELLQYPGDTSNGATGANVNYCRCVARYQTVKNFIPTVR